MKIKCFFIVCAVLLKLVKMESEQCSAHFKCFSEFIRQFIESGLKYDIVIKEPNTSEDYVSETSVLTIEIPSKKLINTIKQIIDLFDLYFDGVSEIDDKFESTESTEGLFINNNENVALNDQISMVNKKDFQTKDNSNFTDFVKVDEKYVKNNEVKIDELDYYYDLEHDNATDYPIIDYLDLYKDTTNEPVDVTKIINTELLISTGAYEEYSLTENKSVNEHLAVLGVQNECFFNGTSNDITRSVFPWIAAIFVKNNTSGRFDYYCDGAILSDRSILTAAQCVARNATSILPEDLIVILGKRSLITMRDEENAVKINRIHFHQNFTADHKGGSDLAVLRTDDAISFSDEIQPACFTTKNKTKKNIQDSLEMATTGWAISGELTSIPLDIERSKLCKKEVASEDTFCANYNNDVATCPSYGGVFVAKAVDDVWRLSGLRTGEISQKGFCFNTGALYTDLILHSSWIQNNI